MSLLVDDASSFHELSALLDQALEMPKAKQKLWLESICRKDEVLGRRVQTLLSHATQRRAGRMLSAVSSLLDETRRPYARGAFVGPYELLRLLGRGGTSSVWLARARSNNAMQVALKLPDLSLGAKTAFERLRLEHRLLRVLDHPNIAKTLEVGRTEERLPYLALEYIKGTPLGVYVRAHKLSLKRRLQLFLQVAKAVTYAHARSILHRDIKPANIMVGGQGRVHLLDFGIARRFGWCPSSRLLNAGSRAFTLSYASPEQIKGEAEGEGTDVYSLGVVLFELLCGRRPFLGLGGCPSALQKAILTDAPPRPSQVAGEMGSPLLEALDRVVLRALRKQPKARYPSARTFIYSLSRAIQRFEPALL